MTKRELERKAKKELEEIASAYLMYSIPPKIFDAGYPTKACVKMLSSILFLCLITEGNYLIEDAIEQYELEQEEDNEKEKTRKT